MHPYCEISDETENEEFYSLNGINKIELGFLTDILNSTSDERAIRLRKAILEEIRSTNEFDIRIDPVHELCPSCNGIGKTINYRFDDEKIIEPCEICKGSGRIVKIKTIRIEPFSKYWSSKFIDTPRKF